MKKYNIKGQKDTQEKKKGKSQMFFVKEKKILEFLGVRKNIVELVQFDSILLCLNLSIFSRYIFLGNSLSIQ